MSANETRTTAGGRAFRIALAVLTLVGTLLSAHAAEIDACNSPRFESISTVGESTSDARAIDLRAAAFWLNRKLIQWPNVSAGGRFRLYAAATESIRATVGVQVVGSDQALDLTVFSGAVPTELLTRFKFVASGVRLQLPAMPDARSRDLHRGQLLLVKEDAQGRVLQSTRLQLAGALDDWYASAAREASLGVTIQRSGDTTTTQFKLWAPTARAVSVCLFRGGSTQASQRLSARLDKFSGVWVSKLAGDRTGSYYTYLVEIYVAGVGRACPVGPRHAFGGLS